jgi:N6-L-threonylcarbamoyladenine synthase
MNRSEALILGVDTSCDETAAAVVADGRRVLSNVIASQVAIHERFGGVVPELASRKHTEIITRIIERAMSEAGVGFDDLSAVAVTNRPGLVGALLVGVAAAKAVAYVHRLPLVAVHHVEGHVYANALVHDLPFPHVCLTVSGGHTALVRVAEGWRFRVLGSTVDDAVGEAYDKVAKLLGLGFPGGPRTDALASGFTGTPVAFPRPMEKSDDYRFSFSGLKTAVRYYVEGRERVDLAAVAAGFQEAAVETLVAKTFRAAQAFGAKAVTLTGGVAANSRLRKRVAEEGGALGIPTFVPPFSLCADNAAMIAGVGYLRWRRGEFADLRLSVSASAPIEEAVS